MASTAISHTVGSHSPSTNDWIIYLARAGYAARGVIYLLVGGLAVMEAFGLGGETTGSRGALATLVDEPWGKTMLFIIGVGLLGYAFWRLIQAHYDLDNHGRDAKGIATRVGMVVSAITHIILATWAFTAVFASGSGDSGGQHRWTAWLLDQPGGEIWLSLIGLAVAGAGVMQIVKGYKAKFEKYLDAGYDRWPWARPLCRFGLIARGVVFVILGWLVVQAAVTHDPGRAGGVGEVLNWLKDQPWGWVIFTVIALGLVAFGAYSILEAVYRKVNPPHHLQATPA